MKAEPDRGDPKNHRKNIANFASKGSTNPIMEQDMANTGTQHDQFRFQVMLVEKRNNELTMQNTALTQILAKTREHNKNIREQLQNLVKSQNPPPMPTFPTIPRTFPKLSIPVAIIKAIKQEPCTSFASDLNVQINDLTVKLEAEQKVRKRFQEKLKKKTTKNKQLEEQIAKMNQGTSRMMSKVNDQVGRAEMQYEEERVKNSELERINESLRNENNAANTQISNLKAEVKRLASSQMKQLVANCRRVVLEKENEDLKKESERLKTAQIDLNGQIAELEIKNHALEGSVEELKQHQASTHGNPRLFHLQNTDGNSYNNIRDPRVWNTHVGRQSNLDQQSAEISSLEKSIQSREQALFTSNVRISQLEAQHQADLIKIAKLEASNKAQQCDTETALAQIEQLKMENFVLKIEIRQKESNENEIIAELQKSKDDLKLELRELSEKRENRHVAVEDLIEKLKSRNQKCEEEISDLEKCLTAREDDLKIKKATISKLKSKNKKKQSEIEVLEKVNKIQKEVCDSGAAQVAELEAANAKLKEEVEELRKTRTADVEQESEMQVDVNMEWQQLFSNTQLSEFIENGRKQAVELKRQRADVYSVGGFEKYASTSEKINETIRKLRSGAAMSKACGNYGEALEHTYTAIGVQMSRAKSKRKLALLWNEAGLLFTKLECHNKAFECYDNSVKFNSSNCKFYYNRSFTRYKLRTYFSARLDAKKALKLRPTYERSQKLLDKIDEKFR